MFLRSDWYVYDFNSRHKDGQREPTPCNNSSLDVETLQLVLGCGFSLPKCTGVQCAIAAVPMGNWYVPELTQNMWHSIFAFSFHDKLSNQVCLVRRRIVSYKAIVHPEWLFVDNLCHKKLLIFSSMSGTYHRERGNFRWHPVGSRVLIQCCHDNHPWGLVINK